MEDSKNIEINEQLSFQELYLPENSNNVIFGGFGMINFYFLKSEMNLPENQRTRKFAVKHILNYNHEVKREIEILQEISHPNIIKLVMNPIINNENVKLVFDCCNQDNLKTLIEKESENINFSTKKYLIKKLIDIFEHLENYCNKRGKIFLHRDIKPENIFMHNFEPMLGDFGQSKIFTHKENHTVKKFRPTTYTDPEINNTKDFTPKSDIYSLGLIF